MVAQWTNFMYLSVDPITELYNVSPNLSYLMVYICFDKTQLRSPDEVELVGQKYRAKEGEFGQCQLNLIHYL